MERKIMVSVLITFYNQVQYVDQAIKMILEQECDFEYEIIIGDDGSDDGTIQKVEQWMDKYPQLISMYIMPRENNHKYNASQRASANRLNLLPFVKGKYFLYLDGDDCYTDKYKLQKQVDILEKDVKKKYSMCAHNVTLFDESDNSTKVFLPFQKRMRLTPKRYWAIYYFHPSSIMMRSEYIKDIPIDIVTDYFNDNLITFCFLKYGGIYYLPDLMAQYTQTGNGIWSGRKKVVGNLRNLMSMDLEERINPNLHKAILSRHAIEMKNFIDNTTDYELETFFQQKIEKDNLTTAKNWFHYSTLEKEQKRKLKKQFIYAKFLCVMNMCKEKLCYIVSAK